jgi:predicted ATPase
MDGKKLLHSITLKNLLSYGSEGVTLSLEPLNVLIGPNASGKSNLIEGVSLLAAAPRDLLRPLREGGGTAEWIWKGADRLMITSLETLIEYNGDLVSYGISFTVEDYRFRLVDEFAMIHQWKLADKKRPKGLIYRYNHGSPRIRTRTVSGEGMTTAPEMIFIAGLDVIDAEQSILSQVRGTEVYPELTYIAKSFGRIAFCRNWDQGRFAAPRLPQRADLPKDFLLEDGSNLGLVLNDLQHRSRTKQVLIEKLRIFYEDLEDISTKIESGTVQVFLHERQLADPIPATRLSDGTLHYLCLLVILCHPNPPPLICIEEPEIGLHPDIIPKVAELLIDASKRTQLIVTTHSETLVSALSEVPEAVVVCERDHRGTQLRRLDPENLKEWLDRYRLGDLWAKGEIGGNRW